MAKKTKKTSISVPSTTSTLEGCYQYLEALDRELLQQENEKKQKMGGYNARIKELKEGRKDCLERLQAFKDGEMLDFRDQDPRQDNGFEEEGTAVSVDTSAQGIIDFDDDDEMAEPAEEESVEAATEPVGELKPCEQCNGTGRFPRDGDVCTMCGGEGETW
jgi:hypothetical protein